MVYNPIDERWDLVITNKDILTDGMKLFAGYRTTEYHRFISKHNLRQYLELDVTKFRTKICVFLPTDDIRMYLPECYWEDYCAATPVFFGVYTKENPKYRVGELAVYMTKTAIPLFPIYESPQGNDFCVIGDDHHGLYRALNIQYIKEGAG